MKEERRRRTVIASQTASRVGWRHALHQLDSRAADDASTWAKETRDNEGPRRRNVIEMER